MAIDRMRSVKYSTGMSDDEMTKSDSEEGGAENVAPIDSAMTNQRYEIDQLRVAWASLASRLVPVLGLVTREPSEDQEDERDGSVVYRVITENTDAIVSLRTQMNSYIAALEI